MKLTRAAVYSVSVIVLLAIAWQYVNYRRHASVLRRRIEDVRRLTLTHATYEFTNADILRLIHLAQQQGGKLHNPIPRDPSKPCYKLIPVGRDRIEHSPSLEDLGSIVIVEETANVNDDKRIIRGYIDGHTSIEAKNVR